MKRSIGTEILLTIVTCGIYGYFWMARVNDDLNSMAGKQEGEAQSGLMVVLLTIVTCGIYGYFWSYKMGENAEVIKANKGQPAGNSPILFLLVSLVPYAGFYISTALMQNTINQVVED